MENFDYKILLKKYIREIAITEGVTPEGIFNMDANWDNIKEGDITKEEAEELIRLSE
jgi:hypothetical protein